MAQYNQAALGSRQALSPESNTPSGNFEKNSTGHSASNSFSNEQHSDAYLGHESGESYGDYRSNGAYGKPFYRRKAVWLSLLALLLIGLGLGIGLGVGLNQNNSSSSGSKGSSNDLSGSSSSSTSPAASTSSSGSPTSAAAASKVSSTSSSAAPSPTVATSGSNGSTITLANGTTFIYTNKFGGNWSSVPFDDSAAPQSTTPPLSTQWRFGIDKMRGVNLGGWLVLEPFITPNMFEPYNNAVVDEYDLSIQLGANLNATLTAHYDTFITEQDFALIAGAGLNWVRLPVPFWALETIAGEPYLPKVGWTYFLKAVQWARKYGIRINFDFHSVPGSQNGWNHSGRVGSINFLNSTMGVVNAQRTLNYIREITEFISQPQYKNVVPQFGFINEPFYAQIGEDNLRSWYLAAYKTIRGITGVGAYNGPFISFHDGFQSSSLWYDFMQGADRVALDTHPYLVFGTLGSDANDWPTRLMQPCSQWAPGINQTFTSFGMTFAGEFSLAITDCGQYLNGVGLGTRYEGTFDQTNAIGSCAGTQDYTQYSAQQKQYMMQFALTQMDSLQNYFFWTWRTGVTTTTGLIANPMWSYSLGLTEGWMPTDPSVALGACNYVGAALNEQYDVSSAYWAGTLAPTKTGGAATYSLAAENNQWSYWPPQSFTLAGYLNAATLPAYTSTGAIATAPTATQTGGGSGWANAADTYPEAAPIATCTYPGPYDAPNSGSCAGWAAAYSAISVPGATATARAAAAKKAA